MRLCAGKDCINVNGCVVPIYSPKHKTRVSLLAMAKEDNQGSSIKSVAVIGVGFSGLSAAYMLRLHGLNVTVFEADGRAGGKLRSISHDGLIWDEGANTMTESEAAVGFLLDNLGIRDKQQFPLSQQKAPYSQKRGAYTATIKSPCVYQKQFSFCRVKVLVLSSSVILGKRRSIFPQVCWVVQCGLVGNMMSTI